MSRIYQENVVVQFDDLRTLVQEEFAIMFEKLASQGAVMKPSGKTDIKLNGVLNDKPLSIQQLAERYDVSKATIHNWRKQKLITGFKMGKGRFFHLEEVEKNLTQYRYLDTLESKGLVEPRKRIQL